MKNRALINKFYIPLENKFDLRMAFAGVLYGIDDLRYQNIVVPKINETEVLIEVKSAGICGSVIPRVKTKGTYIFPTIPGHEFAGIVFAKGNKVQKVTVGDRVSVYPLIPCKQCSYCRENKENLCDNYNYLGSRCDGGFANYVKCPAENVLKIPEKVTFEEAALLEPMAVAFRGVKRGRIRPGDKVIIFGLGPVGLFAAQWAKLMQASLVIGVDRNEHKLKIARKCGIDQVIDSGREDYDQKIKEITGSTGVDLVFECSGANLFQEKSIELIKKFGTISLIGNPQGDVIFKEKNFQLILRKEITLIGNWNSLITPDENEWETVLAALASGKLLVSPIITHRFELKDIKQVFDDLQDKKYKDYCKGIFSMGKEPGSEEIS